MGQEGEMRRINMRWLGLMVSAVLLASGCAGIISETMTDDGKTERLRFVAGSKWSTWDRNPTKQDDSCIILKKESTF
jgi:uncharacterized protein YceK